MRRMRIVAGLGGSGDLAAVDALAEAGADELFVGFVPDAWALRYGFETSPNRRYRAPGQVRSVETLARLVAAATARQLVTHVALNEHSLTPEQLPLADEIADAAVCSGARGLILGSLALGPRYRALHPQALLVASGEAPVYSAAAVRLAAQLGFDRVILPRETSLDDLAPIAATAHEVHVELEAFLLGEWCAYNGALCLTCHGYGTSRDFCSSHALRVVLDTSTRTASLERPRAEADALRAERERVSTAMRSNAGGCTLCALGAFEAQGVGYVKVPGRSTEALANVRKVRALLDAGDLSPAACRAAVDDPVYCNGPNCWHRRAAATR